MGCSKLRNKAPSRASPAPSGTRHRSSLPSPGTTPSQHLRPHGDWPRAEGLQAKTRPSFRGTPPPLNLSPLPTPVYSPQTREVSTLPHLSTPLHSSDQPRLAPPARSFRPTPHPPLSALPEPRPPPPSDSITCPHPAPRFSFAPIQASAPRLSPSQLASSQLPRPRGVDVPRPPRSMLRGGLGDGAPAEGPRAAPLGAGQMQEAFVVPAGASKASALLRAGQKIQTVRVWSRLGRSQPGGERNQGGVSGRWVGTGDSGDPGTSRRAGWPLMKRSPPP